MSADDFKSFSRERWLPTLVAIALAAVTLALYWPVLHFQFVQYDDPNYVYENPMVQRGLSVDGIVWAFNGAHESNWHPLTWLSHMLDYQLFGAAAGSHHLVNVLIHAMSGVWLFFLLRLMTGFLWRSAFIAAVFLWHPAHVESVAWISERKDVLSGFFFMATLWAYTQYVKTRKARCYCLSLGFFMLGLLSKPMLVTVPCVLLLLDFWPLKRWGKDSFHRVLLEKSPFFVLAAMAAVITFIAQKSGGAVAALDVIPASVRMANVPVAYFRYVEKLFWPENLCVLYLLRDGPPVLLTGGAVIFFLIATTLAGWQWRSRPWLAAGWCWFIGMLFPVIGLLQVGRQSMADRYTYLPSIGLALAVVWLVCETWPFKKNILPILAVISLAAFTSVARYQIRFWADSGTLMERTLAIDPKNESAAATLGLFRYREGHKEEAFRIFQRTLQADPKAVNTLRTAGSLLLEEDRMTEAIDCFRQSTKAEPQNYKTFLYLGDALRRAGKLDQAQTALEQARQLNPKAYQTYYSIGSLWEKAGRPLEAVKSYRQAATLEPASGQVEASLGAALISLGQVKEGTAHLTQAIILEPHSPSVHYQAARACLAMNALGEALDHYRETLRADPDFLPALKDLSWLLATGPRPELRNGAEAVHLAEHACELTGYKNALYTGTLDTAYAEAGRFPEAIHAAEKAAQLYQAAGNQDLARLTTGRIELYRAGKKYHMGGN